jgi:hypothetical protein
MSLEDARGTSCAPSAVFKVANPMSNPPTSYAVDGGSGAGNAMHAGLALPSQDSAAESLKERTLRIYDETPYPMRQAARQAKTQSKPSPGGVEEGLDTVIL